jgi:hypothetical protein
MGDEWPSDAELVRRQAALQAEARGVLDALDLPNMLCGTGEPVIVGSFALGLMVWRDIDIEVHCSALNPEIAFEVARRLASVPGVYQMNYRDWTGARTIPELPEGYYWGIRYQLPGAGEWKLDIWLLPAGTTHRTGAPFVESLRDTLTPEKRLTILRLKHIWSRLPSYREEVLSTDIYDAVLSCGVRTPEELDDYLRERGMPGRRIVK